MSLLIKARIQASELEDAVQLLSDLLTKRGKQRFLTAVANAMLADDAAVIDTRDLSSLFREAFLKAGRAASSAQGLMFEFDSANPRAIKRMRDLGAGLVTSVDEATRDSIRFVVSKGMRDGLTREQITKNIEQVIGLHPRYAQAVDNYRSGLMKGGTPKGEALRKSKDYADRLLASRAETITRTEIQKAVEGAKLEYWLQAADLGVIKRSESWRIWKLDPSCEHCEYCPPLEGKRARLGGDFYTGLGKVEGPPLHPNCCCSTELEAPLHLIDVVARRRRSDDPR